LLICGEYISFQRDGGENLINSFELSPLGREDTTGNEIADDGAVREGENSVSFCSSLRSKIGWYGVTYSRDLDETVCKPEIIGLEFGSIWEELWKDQLFSVKKKQVLTDLRKELKSGQDESTTISRNIDNEFRFSSCFGL